MNHELRIKIFLKNNLLKDNRGVALFITLMILTAVLVISLGAAGLVTSGIQQGRAQSDSTKAYFAAEAGAERVLWEIRKNNFAFLRGDASPCQASDYINFDTSPATCDTNSHNYTLSNNSSYVVLYTGDTPQIIFKSIGAYKEVERSVEVSY